MLLLSGVEKILINPLPRLGLSLTSKLRIFHLYREAPVLGEVAEMLICAVIFAHGSVHERFLNVPRF